MIETRRDMQRAKRQSFARGRPEPHDSGVLGETETAALAPRAVTAADDLPAMVDANPIEA